MNEFAIDCRIVPLGDNDPLILSVDSAAGILSVATPLPRPCPKGLNIDGLIAFDMQEDGGLDQIEILYKVPARYGPRRKTPFPAGEKYSRILLHPNRTAVYGPDVTPTVTLQEGLLRLIIKNGTPDGRHKIGPGTVVLLLKNRLIGIEIDLSPFAD
jgi:hypothetical protein